MISNINIRESTRERLLPFARLPEAPDRAGIHAELRPDRGDHRRRAAARRAAGVVVGDAAQPAGEDAAARGLHRGRLYRDAAGGWPDRAVQADEVEGTISSMSSPRRRGPIHTVTEKETRRCIECAQ